MTGEKLSKMDDAAFGASMKEMATLHERHSAIMEQVSVSRAAMKERYEPLLREGMRRFFDAMPEAHTVTYKEFPRYSVIDIELETTPESLDTLYTWGSTFGDLDHVSGPNLTEEMEDRLNAAFDALAYGGWTDIKEVFDPSGKGYYDEEEEGDDREETSCEYERGSLEDDLTYLPY